LSDPFLGEIKLVAFNFPPRGWAFCDGQLMSISQNQALFSILGTTYGGDGQTTFALPDFRGRVPVHYGSGYTFGQNGGEAAHTLTINEMPAHVHHAFAQAATSDPGYDPTNSVWATTEGQAYGTTAAGTMSGAALRPTGGSQPHENRPPFLVLNFAIALTGIYPTRS
jgi:microcystin-dependent protein